MLRRLRATSAVRVVRLGFCEQHIVVHGRALQRSPRKETNAALWHVRHQCGMLVLMPCYCNVIAVLLPPTWRQHGNNMAMSCCSHLTCGQVLSSVFFPGAIAMLLQWYCHVIAMAITWQQHGNNMAISCHDIAMALPCHCHVIAMSLPCHCHVVAMSSPCHCHAIAMLLQCHCNFQWHGKDLARTWQ